jgi:EpsI family protein
MVHHGSAAAAATMTFDRLMPLLGAFMLAGALLAHALKPTHAFNEGAPPVDLATLVPVRFGDWHIDTTNVPIALSPELEKFQNEVYDQMLVRTYIDQNGERIMLTIASVGNKSRNLQFHRPEVCYAALGFQLLSQRKVSLSGIPGVSPIPAMQLVAAQSTRNEPVTYWMRIGDRVVRGNVEVVLARLSYGLRGYIADGLLFRVSNITVQNEEGFGLQQRFVRDLLASMTAEERRALVGMLAI